jgi:hypothetical protein
LWGGFCGGSASTSRPAPPPQAPLPTRVRPEEVEVFGPDFLGLNLRDWGWGLGGGGKGLRPLALSPKIPHSNNNVRFN